MSAGVGLAADTDLLMLLHPQYKVLCIILQGAPRFAICTWPSEYREDKIYEATLAAVKFMSVQLAALPSQIKACSASQSLDWLTGLLWYTV
jgi:hypothetical protein